MVFATVTDYVRRYGSVEDSNRVSAVLADAADMLVSEYEAYYGQAYTEGNHPVFDRAACAVCCAVAHRALAVPAGFEGASQYSQTAGSYNASISFSNPMGDLYLGKTDRKRLGLTGQHIGCIFAKVDEC